MVQVTALYAGLCALLVIVLAWRVVQFRQREKVGLGVGSSREGEIRVRAHANAMEYIPLALVLLLIAELNGLAAFWLYLLGGVFLLARLLHAFGLTEGAGQYHFGRFWGTALSWLVILLLAVINIAPVFIPA